MPDKPQVTVVITAYREPERLPSLLNFLSAHCSRSNVEVIVSVDEPGEELKKVVEEYSDRVTFLVSEDRRGKVEALNEAVSRARGDVLLFLDSDVEIKDPLFLRKLLEVMEWAEVVEIKKTADDRSLIGKLVYYDYVSFGVASYLFERLVGRCAGLNGAAMAFKRSALKELGGFKRAVLEDMDVGFRSYFLNLRYKYFHDSEVVVEAPRGVREWVNQRLRWSTGAWLLVKEYMFHLLKIGSEKPLGTLLAVVVMFPWVPIIPTAILLCSPELSGALFTLWHLALSVLAPLLPLVYVLDVVLALSPPQVYITIPYIAVYASLVYVVARKVGYSVKPHWFLLYFFLYSPVWLSVMLAGFLRVVVFRRREVAGWKI